MSMSICNKWLVYTTVKFSHAFLSSTGRVRVLIATFINLSVVSQCMKLSFIGGEKRKKPQSRI
jgi:hypothetical protein